jgi:hypothetical protein
MFFVNGTIEKITVPFDSSFTDCQTRLEMITTIDYLPIGVRYKEKQVAAYWCTDTEGNYVR